MGILDGVLGGIVGSGLTKVIEGVIEQNGGVAGLVNKFQNHGLGDVARSWVSTGANQPVSAQQIHQVLGSDTVAQLASKFGLDPQDLAHKLSSMLPQVVDKMTPEGTLPKA